MAERKTSPQKGRGAVGKTSAAKSRSKKAAELEAQRIREEAMKRSRRKRQTAAVIMIAAGAVLTLITLIPGSMGWNALYNVTHGLFGAAAFAAGPLIIYSAIVILSNKTQATITKTLVKSAVFLLILCAAMEIFGVGKVNGEDFGKVFVNLYTDGVKFIGGGVFAIILGVPLLFLGKLGAAIIIIVTALVCILLMIDTPLGELVSNIRNSVGTAKENAAERRERRLAERALTEDVYREQEQREREEKESAREEKRRVREERRRESLHERLDRSQKQREIQEIVHSVGDLKPNAEEAPEPKQKPKSEQPETAAPKGEYPDPPQIPAPAKRMNSPQKAEKLIENQKEETRDYREALKKYMERKHPIMRPPEPPTPKTYEDNDAELVPLIDALDKLNAEKGPARVSRIIDAPKADLTDSDKETEKSLEKADFVDDITDSEEAELPFDLEDIISENRPKAEPPVIKPAAESEPKINADIPGNIEQSFPQGEQLKLSDVYTLPPSSLLDEAKKPAHQDDIAAEIKQNADKLVKTLKSFGVDTTYLGASRGPSVTRYELQPAPGVKLSKISNLTDDVALNLAVSGVRIAPVPDKAAVGIEIPNKVRDTVYFKELADTREFRKSYDKKLLTVLGKDISGDAVMCNITKMPHLLIAGTTGSGKSVCVNSLIMSILMKSTPDDVRFIMVDPKQVEFMMYNGIPHLLIPVVTDSKKAAGALAWAVTEMEKRYTLFSENNVRNIDGFNDLAKNDPELSYMPSIVIFIDELADLMMSSPKDVEDSIVRLAQKARAAGMHLVIATQKPTVQVVTGLIKGNIPSRIALLVSQNSDSRVILDAGGAEKLLGNGDMLYQPVGVQKPIRLQGCYVSDGEIERVVDFIKQTFIAEYDESIIAEIERQAEMVASGGKDNSSDEDFDDGEVDDKLEEAIEYVIEAGQASTSSLQRRLKLGYGRAARLIDTMEKMGIVGGYEGSKPRQVLMTRQEWNERKLRQ